MAPDNSEPDAVDWFDLPISTRLWFEADMHHGNTSLHYEDDTFIEEYLACGGHEIVVVYDDVDEYGNKIKVIYH